MTRIATESAKGKKRREFLRLAFRPTLDGAIGRAGLAVTDQALFALSNFALALVLARWLTPVGYGAFVLANTIFLYAVTVYSAFMLEPMMIFGASRFAANDRNYLRTLAILHLLCVLTVGGAFIVAGAVIALTGQTVLAETIAGFGIAGPLNLSLIFLRRACYLGPGPKATIIAGSAFFFLMIAGAYAAQSAQLLSPFSAVLILSASALVGCALVARQLQWAGGTAFSIRDVAIAHFRYGRWSAGAAIFAWAPGNLGILLLSSSGGLIEAAAFRAQFVLLLPLTQMASALAPVILPALVRRRATGEFAGVAMRISFAAILSGMCYAALMATLGAPALHVVYAGKYDDFGSSILPLALSAVFYPICSISSAVLQSLERPNWTFRATVLTAVITVISSFPLIATLGVLGASCAWLLSTIVSATYLGILRSRLPRTQQDPIMVRT